MSEPMTWESDLKSWIRDWGHNVRVEGMKPHQKVPHLGESNYLVWLRDGRAGALGTYGGQQG